MKNFIDINICFNCPNYKYEDNMSICSLNKIIIAYSYFWYQDIIYYNNEEISVSDISDKCENKLEHYIKCKNETFKIAKKKIGANLLLFFF
jgi:hypothetical protein